MIKDCFKLNVIESINKNELLQDDRIVETTINDIYNQQQTY
jgi:hypothetical protein